MPLEAEEHLDDGVSDKLTALVARVDLVQAYYRNIKSIRNETPYDEVKRRLEEVFNESLASSSEKLRAAFSKRDSIELEIDPIEQQLEKMPDDDQEDWGWDEESGEEEEEEGDDEEADELDYLFKDVEDDDWGEEEVDYEERDRLEKELNELEQARDRLTYEILSDPDGRVLYAMQQSLWGLKRAFQRTRELESSETSEVLRVLCDPAYSRMPRLQDGDIMTIEYTPFSVRVYFSDRIRKALEGIIGLNLNGGLAGEPLSAIWFDAEKEGVPREDIARHEETHNMLGSAFGQASRGKNTCFPRAVEMFLSYEGGDRRDYTKNMALSITPAGLLNYLHEEIVAQLENIGEKGLPETDEFDPISRSFATAGMEARRIDKKFKEYKERFPEGELLSQFETLNQQFQAMFIQMAKQIEEALNKAREISEEAYEFTLMCFVVLHPSQYGLVKNLQERKFGAADFVV